LSKKRKRTRKNQHHPCMYFTLPALRLIKQCLTTFEAHLLQTTTPLPNILLAEQTLSQLQGKLDDMLQKEEWEKETPFDYNEIHILYAAAHMYLVDLKFSHQENLMPACILLCKQFSLMVEYAEMKQAEV
jgi:hypothetical protein